MGLSLRMLEKNKYIIYRIINNNVITSRNKVDKEIVLMGKGIAYLKKVGDEIAATQVEKSFILTENEMARYLDIIESIPVEYVDLAIKILNEVEASLELTISPLHYVMLADHIDASIERTKKGIYIKNEMLGEIKNFFPKEYELSKVAVSMIEAEAQVKLPIDEIGFIALHIFNISGGIKNEERLRLIDHVLKIVESYFGIQLSKESIYYERFITHMKYFSARIFSDTSQLTDQDKRETALYQVLLQEHPEVSPCVEQIGDYLKEHFSVQMTREEKSYLIIHIHNLIKKIN